MYKSKILFILLFSVYSIQAQGEEILLSCKGSSVSEFYYLDKPSQNKGYVNDNITVTIVKKGKDIYIRGNGGIDNKLIPLGGNNPQFLERVAFGYSVLYTVHPKTVTIQKSYAMNGISAMINVVVHCNK